MKSASSSSVGEAGAQPTRVTTMAAAADAAPDGGCGGRGPAASPVTSPAMKASPAPVGFSACDRIDGCGEAVAAGKADRALLAHLVDDGAGVACQLARERPALRVSRHHVELDVIADDDVAQHVPPRGRWRRHRQRSSRNRGGSRHRGSPAGRRSRALRMASRVAAREGSTASAVPVTISAPNCGEIDCFHILGRQREVGGAIAIDHRLAVFQSRFPRRRARCASRRSTLRTCVLSDAIAVERVEHEAAHGIIRDGGEESGRTAELHDAGGDVGGRAAKRGGEVRGLLRRAFPADRHRGRGRPGQAPGTVRLSAKSVEHGLPART